MGVAYADFEVGSDGNSGADWANAEATLQAALTDAGVGGQAFCRATNAGTPTKDTAASARIITIPANSAKNPVSVYGCKDGTTAEPPTDSDIAVRGTDTLPILESTGAGNDIDPFGPLATGGVIYRGIRFKSADAIFTNESFGHAQFYDCEFEGAALHWFDQGVYEFFNCEFIGNARLLGSGNTRVRFYGCVWSGTTATLLFWTNCDGRWLFDACDLSAFSTDTIAGMATDHHLTVTIRNCKMPASYTFVSGTWNQANTSVLTRIASTSETALGSTDSVQDYQKETREGTVEEEVTAVRTSGASDGADGGFSYKMTPNIDSTLESVLSLKSPPITGWVEGDGSTSKTFTVYVANSGASDYNEDDMWVEFFIPNDNGEALYDRVESARDKIAGGTTAVTDDTGSTWGTGAANAQEMSATLTPDYQGPVYAIVHFAKRFASSPESLFVDPYVYVT